MPPQRYRRRGGRGGSSSAPSKHSRSSRFRRNSTPKATSSAVSSRPSATPGPSRASATPAPSRPSATPAPSRQSATPAPSRPSVTPAPVRLHSRIRIAQSQSGSAVPMEDSHDPCHEGEADDDADSLNEVILAVDLRERGTVGCAYYVASDEKLYFMEDARLGGVETIEARKYH
ncbi:hypothetical protein E2P81_ATG05007 [Venturia nashicola]|uniref:Uncharacterized protein n=1 Tax=Venturia nashicola TaxID=86259 RepID=A0A4Z1P9Y8_9PEZI|nr:hypothetical protein E6O75_ATG05136 [Venturia nashicola]TLD34842.1 hypothetical protein E2P81_ATG05007 [Venturia nashicola]